MRALEKISRTHLRVIEGESAQTNEEAGMLRLGLSTTATLILHHARTALKANDGNKHRGITSVHSRKADG